jgi:hypothetical protein
MERIAVICVDSAEEVGEFYAWLQRNRSHIIGISENLGCGCCVDMFNIVIDNVAEPMPGEAGGAFERDTVCFGANRDQLLDELLS